MSIDMPGVAVSALLVCACAGAATPNIPQVIAKAATTAAAAVRVVFIKQAENTTNLKDSCQNSLISFSSYILLDCHLWVIMLPLLLGPARSIK
jgi:hypothetical protein